MLIIRYLNYIQSRLFTFDSNWEIEYSHTASYNYHQNCSKTWQHGYKVCFLNRYTQRKKFRCKGQRIPMQGSTKWDMMRFYIDCALKWTLGNAWKHGDEVYLTSDDNDGMVHHSQRSICLELQFYSCLWYMPGFLPGWCISNTKVA